MIPGEYFITDGSLEINIKSNTLWILRLGLGDTIVPTTKPTRLIQVIFRREAPLYISLAKIDP